MAYGVVEYDFDGKPICEICFLSFKRLLTHVRQVHKINERTYKKQFGLDLRKGICSRASSELSRQRTLDKAHICIEANLKTKGATTRFKKGSKGRTRDQLSQQTKIMLIERMKSPEIEEKRKELGVKLGKSGAGNLKRWGNNKKENH